jgi:hypothetical protein
MSKHSLPSTKAILNWAGASTLFRLGNMAIVEKSTHDKEYPAGLFYYFSPDKNSWFHLLMVSSKNLVEGE